MKQDKIECLDKAKERFDEAARKLELALRDVLEPTDTVRLCYSAHTIRVNDMYISVKDYVALFTIVQKVAVDKECHVLEVFN